ncbi:beta strand repeat-containing protein, partial [Sphaerospermopsis aphanizomenoides]|uniref:beta strand repeat-containing protein n=1 Tax=Sphaerospermopsis aphanizomenoides TaxID=459663 RepID=UPI001D15AB85
NIESGTVTVNAPSTWSSPVNLTGGNLTGTGALTISNKLNWSGGTLSGTGKKTVSGTLNLSGGHLLGGTTLETTGTTIWTGNGTLYTGDGAIWNNTSTGTIDLQDDADFYQWYGNLSTFNNAGTLIKSNGTTTGESSISGLFNNTGTVQVKAGTLTLYSGGTNTGSFSIDAGATLNITGNADYNFNTGTNITGVGNFVVSYVTVKIVPAFNYSGAVFVNNSGNLDIGAASTWSAPVNLTSGTITGTGALTISNKLNWSGGTLSGTGKKTVSGTLNLSGYQTLDGTTLETSGTTIWTGTGYLNGTNNAIWNNTSTGTIDLQSDADFHYSYSNATFNNAGTLTKSNGTTTDESYVGFIFNNTGTVNVKKGTLNLTGGGSNSGAFSIDAGATLRITSDYNFNTGNSVTGAGNFNIESGTVTVNAPSTWSSPVNLTGGNLTGTSALTISNKLNWSGGTLSGTGKKTVSGTLNLSGYQTLDGTTLETSGTTIWTGTGYLNGTNNAIWNNTSTGTIDLQSDADFYYNYNGNPATFNNAGTLTKSNGTTTDASSVGFGFNNTGTVDVKKGKLTFTGGYTQTAGITRLSGGSLTFDGSNFLNLQGGNLTGIGTITGNVNNSGGQINPGNTIGTLNITGDYSQSGTGTLNLELSSATTFDKFNISGAADIGGILKLNLTGGFTPTIGTKFAVLTYGSATTKSFNSIEGIDISSSLAFAPTSTGKNLILEVVDQVQNLGAIIFSSSQTVTDSVGDTDKFDFYRFNITTASNVQLKLSNLTANANIWLVDGLGRTIVQGIKTGIADELISSFLDAGTYYVRIFQGATGNNTNYSLQLAASTNRWTVQLGGVYDDFANAVSNDSTGNVYSTGYGYDYDHGNIDAGIAKYSPDGTQTWFQQFTSSSNDYAYGIGNDSFGNVYTTGYTEGSFAGSTLQGSSDAFITKYNTNGTQAWVKQFGTDAQDYAYSISVDSNGNSYIAGQTWGTFAGNTTQGAFDAFIAKYDTNGTQTWVKQFGTSADEEATSIILDSSTNSLLVTGHTYGSFAGSTNLGGLDVFVSKYDTNGTQTWVKQLGTSSNEYSTGVASDSTGNIYVTGYTTGAFTGNTNRGAEDGFLAKYSSSGTQLWVRQFGTTGQDFLQEVKTDSAGNIYVVGVTSGTFTGNTSVGGWDSYIAKYNTSGTQLWVRQFGTTSTDEAVGLNLDNQGNIYVSGRTYGSFPAYTNQGGSDGYIAVFDTNGNQLSVPATPATTGVVVVVNATDANAAETPTAVTANPGVFTLTRTGTATNALTVNYTLSGTATNGTDYSSLTGSVTFAAGSSTATVTINPIYDSILEVIETAILTVATGTDYTPGTASSATVNIAPPSIYYLTTAASWTDAQAQAQAMGGNLVTINNAAENQYLVNTFGGSEQFWIGYNDVAQEGQFVWVSGETSQYTNWISGEPNNAGDVEDYAGINWGGAGLWADFSNNYSHRGIVEISENDLPKISLAVTPSSVNEDGTTNLVYTFTRTGITTNPLTVNYAVGGTADSTDYTGATPGTGKTITFAAGSSTATLIIDPTADTTVETDETVVLT